MSKSPYTKAQVKEFREGLERATKKRFKEFSKAKRLSWHKAKEVILD